MFIYLPWLSAVRSPSLRFARRRCHTIHGLPLPTFLPVDHVKDETRILFLEGRVEGARAPIDRSSIDRVKTRQARMTPDGNLRCLKCGVAKPVDAFFANHGKTYGKRSYCKVCDASTLAYYRGFTLRGIMVTFLHSAKLSAKRRATKPLREEAGQFDIDFNYLLNLWLKQQGRCAYSGIVLSVERCTDWRLSLERLSNTRGSVAGNVVFVCAEFNTSDHSLHAKHSVHGLSQWSKEKVHSLPDRINSSLESCNVDSEKTSTSSHYVANRMGKQKVAPNGDLSCVSCSEWKPIKDFHVLTKARTGRNSWCKLCVSERVRTYNSSFTGFLKMRLVAAKGAAKKRALKGRADAGIFDLTFEDIVRIYEMQHGLCYYFGVKMILIPCSEWMLSIERLDNSKGYTRDNVALICHEFQTTDHSSRLPVLKKGSPQWSIDKVRQLVRWLRCSSTSPLKTGDLHCEKAASIRLSMKDKQ